jgi:predicted alpha-1,2-mannosidase
MDRNHALLAVGIGCITLCSTAVQSCTSASASSSKEPVDYVNPYIGNISHLLVPTYPTVQLPNSMLRVYPERSDYTTQLLNGLPVIVTNHRERSAFKINPGHDGAPAAIKQYTFDNEHLTPYDFAVDIADEEGDNGMHVRYAVSNQSAIYNITFEDVTPEKPAYIAVATGNGKISVDGKHISGWQQLPNDTRVYVYIEADKAPSVYGVLVNGAVDASVTSAEGENACAVWQFADGTGDVALRYGVSFISEEQAAKNLAREITDYDLDAVAARGRKVWNDALGAITVKGGSEDQKTVLYTSYYRTFERPICMSEDGRYFSGFDGKVHDDEGTPFYTDDWIWDTYRAAHPLRTLLNSEREEAILASYLRMAEQMGTGWMPTFPEVNGDTRRMNSNHGVASVADAVAKGLRVDTLKAYEACRRAIEEKTLAPWSGNPAGWLDAFYKEHGYIPALAEGETECDPNVSSWEKRQPVAVTLGTSYDQWCLARIAEALGKSDDAARYDSLALNYRNLFNQQTSFFHPKDKNGNFIEPFDYRWDGGPGARQYYGENNGWVYRWDVPHNVVDLIDLMGGNEKFAANLDQTFREPLGDNKFTFYAKLPDHTGNVGQFSMANEPSLHIPYLYNYAGMPWKTQKCIRDLLKMWFRNDLMGVPGDEDGGGMTSFVVFSSLGFYPVTPGLPIYNIGSPLFEYESIKLSNGKTFEIIAKDASDDNKYIQSARLNGKEWDKSWISHADIMAGGTLELQMGPRPNKSRATSPGAIPPCHL